MAKRCIVAWLALTMTPDEKGEKDKGMYRIQFKAFLKKLRSSYSEDYIRSHVRKLIKASEKLLKAYETRKGLKECPLCKVIGCDDCAYCTWGMVTPTDREEFERLHYKLGRRCSKCQLIWEYFINKGLVNAENLNSMRKNPYDAQNINFRITLLKKQLKHLNNFIKQVRA